MAWPSDRSVCFP
ncbi:hypothetical protein Taro_050947 [Colocasia esculenta]|uniref:Uncharacterized protein n=1 Tax=Colocasia esculenta TaxID=4460 RepID=A0A843XFB7_COLES|nr:hypothetical protein [Colocasia esculenta]